MREVSTSEALMTDPTTPEGAAYWQERHDYEKRLEQDLLEVGERAAERLPWQGLVIELPARGGEAIEQP